MLNKEIFRAYDIRGIVSKTLSYETILALGKVIGSIALEHDEKTILIARDGRESGQQVRDTFVSGIISTGCNVLDIGAVPTPVLCFANKHLKINSAVMITASHNPREYNGFKIILHNQAIFGDDILVLYNRIANHQWCNGNGTVDYYHKIDDIYIAAVKENLRLTKKLHIVIDCGNGIGGPIATKLYTALGCSVTALYCNVDGTFPNHHPDPSVPNNLLDLIKVIKTENADLGLAFDGDADRLGIVDNAGKIIWPDRYIMLLLEDILQKNPGKKVIYDTKCSTSLKETILQLGGIPIMWKTGHSLIKAKMQELNAIAAGEMSGHVFLCDRWFGSDDALYAAARLLEILSNCNDNAHNVFKKYPEHYSTPELSIPLPSEKEKFSIIDSLKSNCHFANAKEICMLDGIRVEFQDGWGLIRPSNTAPKLIVRFEGTNLKSLEHIKSLFKTQILLQAPSLELPF